MNADGAIQITGSHNPKNYNGFKMMIKNEPFFGKDIQSLGIKAKSGSNINMNGTIESLDLDEIRSNYSIAEKYKYANTEELLKDVIAGYQFKIDDNHPDEINVQDHEDAIDWYEGLLDQHRKTGGDTFHAPFGGDTAWREMIWQEMEDLGIYKPHGQGDMRGIDNLPEQAEGVDEGKVKDMAMDQADEFYGKVSDVADKTNDIEKAIIDAWKDEEENPPVWALDDGARDILANAGLIDEEPEEPEMEEMETEEGNEQK